MKNLVIAAAALSLTVTPANASVLSAFKAVGKGIVRAVQLPVYMTVGSFAGAAGGFICWTLEDGYKSTFKSIKNRKED